MSVKHLVIAVKPSVMKWARETIGESVEDVASRLRINRGIVEDWETGERSPTLTQLRELAKFLKRPLAAFFLPGPPVEPALPGAFRTLPGERRILSKKTLLAIRQARRIQNLAKELSREGATTRVPKVAIAGENDDPVVLADKARTFLGVTLSAQSKWGSMRIALENWKRAFEQHGILVSELAMPVSDSRGFSFMEKEFPMIVLSSSDTWSARIFTLFHEYGHLLLGRSGILDSREPEQLSEQGEAAERFCNYFASAFLLPESGIRDSSVFLSHQIGATWVDEEIEKLADQFNVSREVVVRRLLLIGQVNEGFYKSKRRQYKDEYEESQNEKRFGRRVPAKACLRENGTRFANIVFDAFDRKEICYGEISDCLTTKPKYVSEVEKLLRRARAG